MQAEIDPDFQALYELAKRQGDAVAIVSDGFDAYIRPLLARANISGIPAYSNVMGFGTSFKLDFPHHNPDCRFCGVCKAAIALYYINRGFTQSILAMGPVTDFPSISHIKCSPRMHLSTYAKKRESATSPSALSKT